MQKFRQHGELCRLDIIGKKHFTVYPLVSDVWGPVMGEKLETRIIIVFVPRT
jgi:hypothetical protein